MSMPPRRILPRRTVRLRLTALYCVLFLVSGAVLLAIASGLVVSRATTEDPPAPGQEAPQSAHSARAQAQARIHQLQDELAAQSAPHASLGHLLLVASLIALGIMTVLSLVLAWAGAWAPRWNRATGCSRAFSCSPGLSTGRCPAARRSRSGTSSRRPWRPGSAISPP